MCRRASPGATARPCTGPRTVGCAERSRPCEDQYKALPLHRVRLVDTLSLQTMQSSKHKSVLLVEDDRLIRESLAELLELEEYEVHTAENGLEALLWLQHNPEPQLI